MTDEKAVAEALALADFYTTTKTYGALVSRLARGLVTLASALRERERDMAVREEAAFRQGFRQGRVPHIDEDDYGDPFARMTDAAVARWRDERGEK